MWVAFTRYVSTFGALPGPTAHMKTRNISYNFLVANYGGGNGAVDNDDQSLRSFDLGS